MAAMLRVVRRLPTVQQRLFSAAATARETYKVLLPSLSPTMKEGTIVAWKKAEGDAVSVGDVLFEMETDKSVMSVESTEQGYLAKILVQSSGQGIPINQVVALMVEEKGEAPDMSDVSTSAPVKPAAAAPVADSKAAAAPSPAAPASPAPKAAPAAGKAASHAHGQSSSTHTAPLSPAVRYLVGLHNVDLSRVQATGPKGRILKGDILAVLSGEAPAKAAAAPTASTSSSSSKSGKAAASAYEERETPEFADVPTTNVRRVIARRLTESKSTIPHAYVEVEANVSRLSALREAAVKNGNKFSLNDVIIKASALALRVVPQMNVVWKDGQLVPSTSADISVAVATDGGLFTPIVKGADGLGIMAISQAVKDLAAKARAGKLQPHEFQGGSFSISNLGMFGVRNFSAVINPPQTGLLAVGSTRVAFGLDKKPVEMMSFTLSYDARAVDAEEASKWLAAFRSFIEAPEAVASSL